MRLRPALTILPALVLCAPALAACGGESDDGDDGKPVAVTSAYPFEFLIDRVAGDFYTVESLAAPGQEPHDIELTPRQVADVQSADLVVYVEHFQTAVDDAVTQADRGEDATVELGEFVNLMASDEEEEEGHDHEHEEGAEDEDHDHAEEEGTEEDHDHAEEDGDEHAEEEEEEGHEGHDHGGIDPHFWLDPNRMALAADAIADALGQADPDHADDYTANAEALKADLEQLDAEYVSGLETCERRTIVTSHEAFAYLADTYDLTQVPIAGLDPSAEPSSAQLAEITDLVNSQGITTIFTEELVDPAIAQTVADATGVTTATLDPIEGLSDETSGEDYLSLMRANLAAIQEANGCQ